MDNRVRPGPLIARATYANRRQHWLPADEQRWRTYHVGDDLDEPAELVFYCPACAERELGGD
jgi:hypothetical protein